MGKYRSHFSESKHPHNGFSDAQQFSSLVVFFHIFSVQVALHYNKRGWDL